MNKLIVALDVPNLKEAETLVKKLSPQVGIFKVGKELFTAAGPGAVAMIHSHGAKVFLDLKFHDIPNTVAAACEAASRLGVFMMNVHASGGKKMMQAASAVNPRPILLGVTVLTSLSEEDLKEVGVQKNLKEQAASLARLAETSGLDGVVASGREISLIRETCGKKFLIVTPGVRPAWAAQGDQKRIVTPREAMTLGADYIVVGRPITQDPSPAEAAKKILAEIS
ncbi:MAG: orotidine-5'-phosphate decarboxylase [Candidatus Omnitrophica bacterium]|nr:orotidine-5'-phosphate decarboxylase [Candidatus Omnitrophota bacterium]